MIWLAEIEIYDPATDAVRVLRYASGQGHTTRPTESPPNASYDARLLQPAGMTRTAYAPGSTDGHSTAGYGELELSNRDGLLDAFLTYGVDGRRCVLRRGTEGAAYPDGFPVALDATMEGVEVTTGKVAVKLRDRQAELRVPLQPTMYAGDNVSPDGLEGEADLKGKPKPRAFGVVKNVPAVCVNPAKLIYQVSDGPVYAVNAVYDWGTGLTNLGAWSEYDTGFGAGKQVYTICFGDALFVAAGGSGNLATSPDGATWTARTSQFGVSDVRGVAYDGSSLYCAVGQIGKISTSPDGITWTARTSGVATDLIAVTWGNGLWIASGNANTLLTSPDGITWTSRTTGMNAAGFLSALAYGNGQYAVANDYKEIAISADAITWTVGPFLADYAAVGLLFGGGRFVATGWNPLLSDHMFTAFSEGSALTFDLTVMAGNATFGVAIAYSAEHDIYLAVGNYGACVWSIDGATWIESYGPMNYRTSSDYFYSAAYGAGVFCLGGINGRVWISTGLVYADATTLEDDDLAPAPGSWGSWLSGGYIRLGAPPAGIITADVTVEAAAADRSAGQLFARLLSDPLGAPLMEYSNADVDALDLADDAPMGLWTQEPMTVAEALDHLARSIGVWWGVDRHGVARIRQWTAPSGDPVLSLTASDIVKDSFQRLSTQDGTQIPSWRTTLRYARNYTVQTEVAGAVTDERRAYLAEAWRKTSAEDVAVQIAHRLARDVVIDTAYASVTDAAAEATRRQALRGTLRHRYALTIEATDAADAVDLGDVIQITHPRFGFAAGLLCRVLEVQPDLARRRLTLVVWR